MVKLGLQYYPSKDFNSANKLQLFATTNEF